jgi:hypothetical protein
MKAIKDIEKCYDLLHEARQIFSDLNGDSVVEVSKMRRWCVQVDRVLDIK